MENTALLVKVVFFRELTPGELAKIAAIARSEFYHTGQQIFATGSANDAFYIIKSGSVMVKKEAMVLATPGVGDPVGEMSFVDRGVRSATVAAIEDTELVKISCDLLESLLAAEPVMAAKIYRAIAVVLSRRLREMDETIYLKFHPAKF
jgi:CRP-like cAMP-binding protein